MQGFLDFNPACQYSLFVLHRWAPVRVVGLLVLLSKAALLSALDLDVKEHTLKNGLRLLVVERHDSPIFSAYLTFRVGSVDEGPGITGVSHLLEHMLFKGTQRLGTWNFQAESPIMKRIDQLGGELDSAAERRDDKAAAAIREQIRELHAEQRKYIIKDEIWDIYLRSGAVGMNASTGQETTQYFLSLPANRLELWAIIESERFKNPVFREFYPERDVVLEERRLRTDTQPSGKLSEVFSSVAFPSHPYGSPVIGWPSDLKRLRKERVGEYYRAHYNAGNAVAVLVGDVRFREVVGVMEKYFGDLPGGNRISGPLPDEMEQVGEKRVAVEYDAEPEVLIGYHTPQLGHPDQYTLEVLEEVLSGGRTGRLYRGLVEKKRIAAGVSASANSGRLGGLFTFSASPRAPHRVEAVEKAIYEEIEILQMEPVPDWEISKAKNNLEVGLLRRIRANRSLARLLGSYETLAGGWKSLLDQTKAWQEVTAQDLTRVANKYLKRGNRTVAWIERTR